MSFEVGVIARFHASHHLVGNFGPASQLDITLLQGSLSAALAQLDQRDLNTLPELADPNPSAEVVARHLTRRMAPSLVGTLVEALTVRVWESDEAFAAYTTTSFS